jgi:transcriptional regulator with XRE-family HTH domain
LKTIEDLNDNCIDNLYTRTGLLVKKYREAKGYTQLQLSQALGFKSVGLVSQSELYLNKQHFNLKHLYHIAYILDCDIKDLL